MAPSRLFVYALAFRFSSGRGRCFSPGGKALLRWYGSWWRLRLFDRAVAHWWLAHLGRE